MVARQIGARALSGLLGPWREEGAAYLALADRIRLLLIDGRLTGTNRLPAERELAATLGLSRTTVAAAYRRLREAGYATSVTGSGTTLTLPPSRSSAEPGTATDVLDLTKASLPATGLLEPAIAGASEDLRARLGGIGYDTFGQDVLRTAIAEHYTGRGLPTDPDQILVTTGGQSAIALVARVLLERGDRAFLENPTYPNAADAIRLTGARLVSSPVTVEDGWDIDGLQQTLRRSNPALAYVIPDFHNPTSRTMSLEDRMRLVDAALSCGTTVLTDDTLMDLAIDPQTPLPLLGTLAGPDQVIHVGSSSKLLWGGLRIGWIRTTPRLVQRLAAARAATDLGTPVFEQLLTARLLPQARAIAAERAEQLRHRRDALAALLADRLPDWTFPPRLTGGITAWVDLNHPVSSQLALAARTLGLLITAGPRFSTDGAFETYLRLPITAEPDQLTAAVDILATCWTDLSTHPRSILIGTSNVA